MNRRLTKLSSLGWTIPSGTDAPMKLDSYTIGSYTITTQSRLNAHSEQATSEQRRRVLVLGSLYSCINARTMLDRLYAYVQADVDICRRRAAAVVVLTGVVEAMWMSVTVRDVQQHVISLIIGLPRTSWRARLRGQIPQWKASLRLHHDYEHTSFPLPYERSLTEKMSRVANTLVVT